MSFVRILVIIISGVFVLGGKQVVAQVSQQFAQVGGKIADANGGAISHASITIEGTSYRAVSDESGNFTLLQVPFGKYRLIVSSLEIDTVFKNIRVNSPKHQLSISANKKKTEALDAIEIVRKSEKQKLETSGFATTVIETKDAALLNVTTNELLDRSVGIRVRQNGGEGAPIEYNLNGMSGSSIGIFIDGIESSTYGSSFNLNTIPPAMIERIEVYKGVLPAHLSGNYLGGAINVILKKDLAPKGVYAALSYGSFNTQKADLAITTTNEKTGLTFRASGFYNKSDNNYEIWGKFSKYTLPNGRVDRYYRTERPNDKFESKGGKIEAGFANVSWADYMTLAFQASDTYKEIPHGITMTRPYFGRFNKYQSNVLSLNYKKQHFLMEGLHLQVNAVQSWRSTYLQDTVSRFYNWDEKPLLAPPNADGEIKPFPYAPGKGQQGDAVMSEIDRNISNIRTNLAYNVFHGHTISLDYKFEHSQRTDQDLLNPERSQWITENLLTTNILAANYEARFFNDRIQSNIFGKYSHYMTNQRVPMLDSNTGELIFDNQKNARDNQAFGAALAAEILPNSFLLTSVEQSFIMPTDRHIYGEPENNLLPNSDILAERALNFNLGARLNRQLGKNRWDFYGNFFWRNGYDKIALQTRTDPVIEGRESQVEDLQVTQFVNLSRTQSIGFEGEISFDNMRNLNVALNFSKFNTLFKLKSDERGNPHALYNKQVPNEPFFTVNSFVNYRLSNIFQKGSELRLQYDAGYVAPFSTIWIESEWFTTPTQFAQDLGVSYRFPNRKLIVSLDAKNITNEEIYDNFGVQKPGRAFYIKLNYTINSFKK